MEETLSGKCKDSYCEISKRLLTIMEDNLLHLSYDSLPVAWIRSLTPPGEKSRNVKHKRIGLLLRRLGDKER